MESAEVVDADDVIEGVGPADAVAPPPIAVRLVGVPVIDGIAPELTGGGEHVRRHAGHIVQLHSLPVDPEHVGMGPHIHRVSGDIEGNVTDDLDAVIVGVLLQRTPLLGKLVLAEGMVADLVLQGLPIPVHGILIPVEQVLVRPLEQRHAEVVRTGLEQSIVHQLAAVLIDKGIDLVHQLRACVAVGFVQKILVDLIHPGIVHPVHVVILIGFQIPPAQQALVHQSGQVDKQGVARRRGGGHVGGCAAAGRDQGQQLPVALAGAVEKVYEETGFSAHGANAELTGQGGNVHQNAAGTRKHRIKSFLVAGQRFAPLWDDAPAFPVRRRLIISRLSSLFSAFICRENGCKKRFDLLVSVYPFPSTFVNHFSLF